MSEARAPSEVPDRRRPARRWSRILLRTLLALAVLGTPAGVFLFIRYSPTSRALRLRAEAQIDRRLGKMDDAIAALQAAVALAPTSPDASLDLGELFVSMRDGKRGREAFERACAIDPHGIRQRVWLTVMALEERDKARARPLVDWLVDPAREARTAVFGEQIPLLACRVAILEGDAATATRYADRALAIASRSIPALRARASLALSSGDAAFARHLLDEVAGDMRDPELRVLLSEACERMSDSAAAREAVAHLPGVVDDDDIIARRAEVEANAENRPALEAIRAGLPANASPAIKAYVDGLSAALRGDAASAESGFRRAVAANAGFTVARLELAKALVALNEYSLARADLRAVLDKDPLSRPARLQLARVLILEGDFASASTEAEALVRSGTRDLDAMRVLVTARAKQGKSADAVKFFSKLEAEEPANEVAAMGRNLAWLGALELDSAIDGSERLLADKPTARGALEVLAAAYAAKRGLADSLQRLRLIVAEDQRLLPMRIQVAGVYAALGRLDIAEEELRGIIGADPTYAPAHLALGSILEAHQDFAGARAEAEAVREHHDDDLAARSLLVRSLVSAGDPARALEVAEEPLPRPLLGRAKMHALAIERTGLAAAVEVGDLDRAARRFKIARELDEHLEAAILGAAALALGMDDAPVLADAPADADAEWVAAVAAIARGDAALAVEHARLSHPETAVARTLVLIDGLLLGGDREGALTAAEEAVKHASDAEGGVGPVSRALREYAAGATGARVKASAGALDRLTLSAAFGFARAVKEAAPKIGAAGGDLDLFPLLAARSLDGVLARTESRACLEDALRRRPDSLPLLEANGAMLVERGEYAAATQLLERAVSIAPEESFARIFVGLAREKLGDRGKAIAAYKQATKLDQSSALAHGNLAWLLTGEADTVDDALSEAARAHVLAPSSSRVLDTLGFAELLRNRTTDALSTLARARDASPREPRIRYHLALAYRRMGLKDQAMAELDMAVLLGPDTEDGISAAKLRDALLTETSGGRRPGVSWESAGPLAAGDDEVKDSLGPRGARHFFRLEIAAPSFIDVHYRGPRDATTDIRIERRDPRTSRVVKATSVPATYDLTWPLRLPAGVYALEIEASAGTTIATYRLSLVTGTAAPVGREQEPNDASIDAAPLLIGTPVRARLGPLRDRDVFILPGSAGPLDVAIRGAPDAPLTVSLGVPSLIGDTILKTFTVAPSATAIVPRVHAASGDLSLIVESSVLSGTGEYEILARPSARAPDGAAAPLDEPDDLPGVAHLLDAPAPGGPALVRTGTISPAGDRDLFVMPPGHVSLSVRAPADLALYVDLLLSTGSESRIARSIAVDAGGEVHLGSVGTPGLIVAIHAADAARESLSPYVLSWGAPDATVDVEPNDDLERASTLVPGVARGAIDSAGDRDFYRVATPRAAAYMLGLRAIDGPLTVSLLGLDAGGAARVVRLIEVAPARPLRIEQWVPGPGGAAFAVDGRAAGRYEIALEARTRTAGIEEEPNDDAASAQALGFGEAIEGALDAPTDRDVFSVDVPTSTAEIGVSIETLSGAPPVAAVLVGDLTVPDARTPLDRARSVSRSVRVPPGSRVFIVLESAPGLDAALPPTRYRLRLAR